MTPPLSIDWRQQIAELDSHPAHRPSSLMAARLLLRNGRLEASLAAYKDLLDQQPQCVSAIHETISLLRRLNRASEAKHYWQRLHKLERENFAIDDTAAEEVDRFLSAADIGETTPNQAPKNYVSALFDVYADKFEHSLRHNLQYRAPEQLLAALAGLVHDRTDLRILDLGCGTGLVGEVFRSRIQRLDGIDLSKNMIQHARDKEIYDNLIVGDIVERLQHSTAGLLSHYDLVICADVFIYIGELQAVFDQSRQRLQPGGLLAFTIEVLEESPSDPDDPPTDYVLTVNRRYAHSASYIQRLAEVNGFTQQVMQNFSIRLQNTHPVLSYLFVLTAK